MIEPYATEKQCTRCRDCKPLAAFPTRPGRTWSTGPVCQACKDELAEKRAETAWTDTELDLIYRVFPSHGSNGCAAYMPNRTPTQIGSKAKRMGVYYTGKRNSGTPAKESPWAVPAHDYTDADIAWQATRIPPPPAEFRLLGAVL